VRGICERNTWLLILETKREHNFHVKERMICVIIAKCKIELGISFDVGFDIGYRDENDGMRGTECFWSRDRDRKNRHLLESNQIKP
jgi:hypothetical protein